MKKIMKHGGDLLTYKDKFHGELIDYSSNINPLGTPPNLEAKIMENFSTVTSYPDIKYRELKKSVGKYLGCEISNVVVGNGAMEIIDLFNLISKRVLTLSPAFSEYSFRAKIHNKEYLELKYKEDFTIDMEELEANIRKDDLIILGNPNNPTGMRIPKDELIGIYELVKMREAYLVLDEAFFEFVPEDYDSIEIFREYGYENIGIIRAATKFFGMPGIRLGYGCVSKEMVEILDEKAVTWSVNCFADIAGRYIFDEKEYIEKSKAYIACEREFMLKQLKDIDGLYIYNTLTNYILIKLKNRDEEEVFEEFLKYGFVIRKCSSFKVLGDNHIRIAIKDRENNMKILDAFKQIKF